CIGCRTCVDVCRSGTLSLDGDGMEIDRSRCIGCGTCAEECPSTAMEILGKEWTLDDLTHEVIKDRAYFEKSKGGITVSGGEPGMQAQFVAKFLKSLRERGLHTALDTCGLCSREAFDLLLPYSSMVLYDLKETDPVKHKKFTGETNEKIFQNLLYVSEYMKSHLYPATLWIRTPVIPGLTATEENITGIGRFIAENLKGVVDRWELCAFNNLCRDKYTRLGREWMLKESLLLKKDFMETLSG
ncbi:MAG: glycyl-radical enzyme activating protein, partial [Deltaproteobacteria bacterium]|nr:glycyl-radical enzyme activating protein [Deltaproteobacteria bacterium]